MKIAISMKYKSIEEISINNNFLTNSDKNISEYL